MTPARVELAKKLRDVYEMECNNGSRTHAAWDMLTENQQGVWEAVAREAEVVMGATMEALKEDIETAMAAAYDNPMEYRRLIRAAYQPYMPTDA